MTVQDLFLIRVWFMLVYGWYRLVSVVYIGGLD